MRVRHRFYLSASLIQEKVPENSSAKNFLLRNLLTPVRVAEKTQFIICWFFLQPISVRILTNQKVSYSGYQCNSHQFG